ncbi:MAG: HPr kinase/phosphatase C-terminal domain-containing protein [Rhodospirillales bacterium]|nr:HPr kinase/phosphatase C-terminal domain-containing protein [Rhodospirillales bacterium]
MECVRGTCVAIDGSGVLLRGSSGAGKSDLALRVLATGGRLVADDYTYLQLESGGLRASPPESLAGLLEVHGIGIIRVEAETDVPLIAVIDLVPQADVERLPVIEEEQMLGVTLVRFQLTAFETSAAAKVRLVAEIARGNVSRLT